MPHNDEIHRVAPNGCEINGTSELIPGAADVYFEADGEWEHSGNGTKMFWDGSDTQTIEGCPLFTDTDGSDWLLHHLLPPGCEPMSKEQIDKLNEEFKVGYALNAARALEAQLGHVPTIDRAEASAYVRRLAIEYHAIKSRNIEMVEEHIDG